MITIKADRISYKGEHLDKKLVISLNVEGCEEILSTSAVMDLYKPSLLAGQVPDVLIGLLLLSAEVYAIDRTFLRKKYSINGWSREFDVTFKVINANRFTEDTRLINSLLNFLTGDYWVCHFEEAPDIEWLEINNCQTLFDHVAQVNLFSGGMDSLIGAIDYLEQHDDNHKLFLVSHYDSKMGGPKSDQEKLIDEFKTKYQNKYIWLESEGISPSVSKELTSRSRSLMFLAMAILVASYKSGRVIVPENGPVSLNFPLSPSRRAACSTRTTNPIFINMIRNLLSTWDIPVTIENPYEFKTKGEMVMECKNRDYLLSILQISNSCGKRGGHQFMYDNHNATHCGRCMPCMYRKASLVGLNDQTTYGINLGTLFKQPKKVSNDFYAMLNYLRKQYTDEDIAKELLVMGMDKKDAHFNDYIDLVKRTRTELKNMLLSEAPRQVIAYAEI